MSDEAKREAARAIARSVSRAMGRFETVRYWPPAYLLVDAARYVILRDWFDTNRVPLQRLDRFMGLKVIVVPLPEFLAVVAEPWNEVLTEPPFRPERSEAP